MCVGQEVYLGGQIDLDLEEESLLMRKSFMGRVKSKLLPKYEGVRQSGTQTAKALE